MKCSNKQEREMVKADFNTKAVKHDMDLWSFK